MNRKLVLFLLTIVCGCGSLRAQEKHDHERWNVKTLTDRDTASIHWIPKTTTIEAITGLPSYPRYDFEKQVVSVTAKVDAIFYEREDGDFHLVLSNGLDSIVAEIPNPDSVGQSAHRSEFAIAANWARMHRKLSNSFWFGNRIVKVTGLLFQDFPHAHVTGDGGNHIEIHPVLSIEAIVPTAQLGAK